MLMEPRSKISIVKLVKIKISAFFKLNFNNLFFYLKKEIVLRNKRNT